MKHIAIASFHKDAPGPVHVGVKFLGGPKPTHALCGMDVTTITKLAPPDPHDPRHFWDDLCDICGDKFVI